MKVIRYMIFLLPLVAVLMLTSCSTVKETSTEKEEDVIKPLWTNENSLNIADEFVSQLDIKNISGSKPVFLIGKIEAAGVLEVITSGLEYDIELKLVNSGKVSFIADKKARDNERENRKSMLSFETEDKFYTYYKNLKVDKFVEGKLIGDIKEGIEESYIISLKLIDIKSREVTDWQKVVSR